MSMVKHKKLSRIMVAILAVMTILAYSLPANLTSVHAADQTGNGSEGIMAYHHSGASDPKFVDYNYNGTKPNFTEAPDLLGQKTSGNPWYVYCINQQRNAKDNSRWNQHFRWRWNLGANKWLLDNSKNQNIKDGMSNPAGSEAYDMLAKILYYGFPHNYDGGNFSYDETQKAVEQLMGGMSTHNTLYEKAANSSITVNGNLYMFIADSDAKQIVQNTVGLAVWGAPDNPPEKPDNYDETPKKKGATLSIVGHKTIDGKAEGFDASKPKQFGFRMYKPAGNLDNGNPAGKGDDTNFNYHTRYIPQDTAQDANGNDIPGEIAFATFTYNTDDIGKTFSYRFREIDPAEDQSGWSTPVEVEKTEGMIYDHTEFTLDVKVEADGDGVKLICNGNDVTNGKVDAGTWNNKTKEEGTLKTTVTAGGQTGTASKAATLSAADASKVTSITDKIDYEGLVGGATYSVQGRLMDVTDPSKPTQVAESAVKNCEAAASGKGSWEIEFTNIQLEAGRTFVVYENATRKTDAEGNNVDDGETLKHEKPDDKAQTIVVQKSEEPPVEKKTVKISKKALGGSEVEGAQIVVKKGTTEVEKWTSTKTAHEFTVEPGEYTMTETVAPTGYKKVSTEIKFTVAADGKVTLGTTIVDNGGKISVMDSNHIILEDAPDNALGTLKTTVTAGGKTASDEAEANLTVEEVAQAVPVTDKIDYEGLVGGATYSVTGTLMDVTNEDNPTDVATVEQEYKADASGTGSWTMDFGKVELKPGRKYVVFEGAILTKDAKGEAVEKGDILTHMDVDDKAQTIVVEYESKLSAKKTTDVTTATVGDIIPFTITITNDGSGDAKDVKVTDYLGEYLKYVSDSNGGNNVGQNVHWTVDIPAGESVEIDIDCEVSEDAVGKIVNKVYVFDSTKPNAEPVEYEDEAEVAFNPPEDGGSDDSDSKKKASNPTKVSTLARTSDEFNLGMWAVLMAISAFALAAAAMRRRYER